MSNLNKALSIPYKNKFIHSVAPLFMLFAFYKLLVLNKLLIFTSFIERHTKPLDPCVFKS